MWPLAIPGIITALAGLFGGSGDKGTQMSPNQRLLLDEALKEQNRRMINQGPLSDMVTRLATALMPRSAAAPLPRSATRPGLVNTPGGDADRERTREGPVPTGSAVNEAVTRLGRSRLFQMPPTR